MNSLTVHEAHPTAPRRKLQYKKVLDARKRPIRGLWIRNGRYYARLAIEDPKTNKSRSRRVPLDGVDSPAKALAELNKLRQLKRENTLPILHRTPKFAEYVKEYLAYFEKAKDAKRPKTLKTERVHLDLWVKHMGEVRLNKINRAMINAFIAKQQDAGWCGRTVNLGVTVLRNVLNRAVDDNYLRTLPTENLRPLKWTPKKRELMTLDQIEAVCKAGMDLSKNGQQLADYLHLMAFCGSRKTETLRIRWTDVDFERHQITIGADGQTKNHEMRVVDFNDKLAALLKDMYARRAPDSQWLFPSPQRGEKDLPAKSFVESMRLAKKEANISHFGFHDCRHFFISYCVMAGIDYMTISRWVGHKDGGVLIGRVYGHLSNEHAKRQAKKLSFIL